MPYLRPSPLLLLILSVLLSVLILSCDPDEAKKKPTTPNTQDKDKDDKDPTEPTKKPPESDKPVTPPPPEPAIPVDSLDAVRSKTAGNDGGTDARTRADTSGTSLGWVFQDKEIIFSTTALDEHNNEIPTAKFVWEWRKRGKEKPSSFGRTWTEITGQTTATATLDIPADERVGAYELRVSATSGKKKVESKKLYKFTVRKSGCPAPSATNQPATFTKLEALIQDPLTLTDTQLQAIDTSKMDLLGTPFINNPQLDKDISCWDVSNVNDMVYVFFDSPMFNQDISDWDTSNVTNMTRMFSGAAKFNQDLSGWDVAKVSTRNYFAEGATNWTKAKPSWL